MALGTMHCSISSCQHFFFSLVLYFFSPHPAYITPFPLLPNPYRKSYFLALCIKGQYHIVWFCPAARQDNHGPFPEWKHRFKASGPLKQGILFPCHSERNKELCWQRKLCDLVVRQCPDMVLLLTHTEPSCSRAKKQQHKRFLPFLNAVIGSTEVDVEYLSPTSENMV